MPNEVVIEAGADYGIKKGSLSFTPQGLEKRMIVDTEEIDLTDDTETKEIHPADCLRIRASITIGRTNEITIKGRSLSELGKIEQDAIGWLEWGTYGKGGKEGQDTTFYAMVKCTQSVLGGSAKRDLSEYEVKCKIIESADPSVECFYSTTGGKPIILTSDAIVDGVLEIPNGSTVDFRVALVSAPDVSPKTILVQQAEGMDTIEVTSPALGELTFTASNWSELQTCTLGTDAGTVGDMALITVSSADSEYATKSVVCKIVAAV